MTRRNRGFEGIRPAFANASVEIPNDPEKLIDRIL
jgi:hypothetical protein